MSELLPTREPMGAETLSYALITPVRDEREALPALIRSIVAQTALPEAWIIVDTGSTDETAAIAAAAAGDYPWIRVLALPDDGGVARGGPIARAFEAGLEALDPCDVVIKLDADITMRSDYFSRLL